MKANVQSDRSSRSRGVRISHGESRHSIAASSSTPDAEQVRRRAFEIYEERCRAGDEGSAEGDWIRAESELNGGDASIDRISVL